MCRVSTLLLLFTSSAYAHPTPLLTLAPSYPLPDTCAGAEILLCSVARVDWSAIQGNASIALPTGDVLDLEYKTRLGDDQGITAVYSNTEGSRAVITFHHRTLYGTVYTSSGQEFRIETTSNTDQVVWAQIDQSVLDDDDDVVEEDPLEAEFPDMRMTELLAKGRADNSTVVEYSVTVYYTKGFKESTADPETFINQVVAETNDGYKNSGIPLRVKLHCVLMSDIPDGLPSFVALRLFTIRQASLNLVRRSADAAVLLVRNYSRKKNCGVNWFNSFSNGQTIGTVRKACALGYFSFGHEIAHGFGLAHDRRVASHSSVPFAYGNIIAVSNRITDISQNITLTVFLLAWKVQIHHGILQGQGEEGEPLLLPCHHV